MCGSRKGLEIDKAWARDLIQSFGPDGFYYSPLSKILGYLPPEGVQPSFAGGPSGRVLGALSVYYTDHGRRGLETRGAGDGGPDERVGGQG